AAAPARARVIDGAGDTWHASHWGTERRNQGQSHPEVTARPPQHGRTTHLEPGGTGGRGPESVPAPAARPLSRRGICDDSDVRAAGMNSPAPGSSSAVPRQHTECRRGHPGPTSCCDRVTRVILVRTI